MAVASIDLSFATSTTASKSMDGITAKYRPVAQCAGHLHVHILSAILGVKIYTKELTPQMVGMLDTHHMAVRSALRKRLIR